MNNFIKQVIEEKFASKAQQRFFYAQAGKGGKKGKKWSKWAKEFSDKTDFDKIPNKVENEEEVDEMVDKQGNIEMGKKPTDLPTKGVTSSMTTDEFVKTGRGQMGNYGTKVSSYVRYSIEEGDKVISKDELMEIAMKDALGYEATMGQDKDREEAEDYFKDELGISDKETEERLDKMGYDEKLPDDKVRLVENPKKFIEEYIDNILSKRKKDNDIVSKSEEEIEEKELNPIIVKQLKSLKNTLDSHNLSVNDIMKHLKGDE